MFKPSLQYKQRVKIIQGFYKGMAGMVVDIDWDFGWTYNIVLDDGHHAYRVKQKYIIPVVSKKQKVKL